MVFKYKKILTTTDKDWKKVEEAGKDGWELVTVDRFADVDLIFYFKKSGK